MKKTVNDVIRNFNVQALEAELVKLHEAGTPRLIIETLKKEVEIVKATEPQVKGISKKHQIGELQVANVYVATDAEAKNYALPHHGTPTPTTILYIVLENGNEYYYDYFNNKIGATLEELNLATLPTMFTNWLMQEEYTEDSGLFEVSYRFSPNAPVLTAIVTGEDLYDAAGIIDKKYPKAIVIDVAAISKGAAIKLGLNF